MLKIIPQPNEVKIDENEYFCLPKTIEFFSEITSQFCYDDLKFFVAKYELGFIVAKENRHISIVKKNLEKEQYILQINKDGICIFALDSAGAQYAIQTLKQIILQYGTKLPAVYINDKPKFAYRGFMLDVGRYFYDEASVKQFIDIMVLHKLNVFHWHLTEDQGWRIEIKKYPNLTSIGSIRAGTNFSHKEHKGFYTQKQIKEIVQYCHERNIKVIPEIDMPGHMVAAIASYPYLSCFKRNLKVATHWGVKHDILCAGKEETFKFVFDVLNEVMAMFPDKIIHLGGDEADKHRWEICPDCQKVIKEKGLKDCNELQAYFLNRINAHLKSKGFSAMMWNEAEISGKMDADIAWQMWDGDEQFKHACKEEADKNRQILSSSSCANYLDFPYNMISLKTAYCGQPDFKNQLGIEGCLWTEYVPKMRRACYQMFPRLGAIAENAWTQDKNRNYDNFKECLNNYYRLLETAGISYWAVKKDYEPNFLRAKTKQMWFNRRVLHWEGVHNFFDDKKMLNQAKKDLKKDKKD